MSFFEKETVKTENTLWVEKYRPQTLKDYIGNDLLKEKVQSYLDNNDVPHLLLYGKAGTGKTTLAKIIAQTIECDMMVINASDENNVETVRNKVKNFASGAGFKGFKIIILDEFDYMTPNAQAILRNLMETFSRHTRFILTCNYHEKIIEPILSRCQTFAVNPPSKKEVAVHVTEILNKEGIRFDIKDVADIISSFYPDIRRVMNTCQLQSSKGELKVDKQTILQADFKNKIVDLLASGEEKRNAYMQIRQIVGDNKVNDFAELYTALYERLDDYAAGNTANVILELAQGQFRDALVIDKEICFMATIIAIINIIK
jgi:DNA polymerase III delta prime subunit